MPKNQTAKGNQENPMSQSVPLCRKTLCAIMSISAPAMAQDKSQCYLMKVQVPFLNHGQDWDTILLHPNHKSPDITALIDGRKRSSICRNSFTCAFTFSTQNSTAEITIRDWDGPVKLPQVVGSGKCDLRHESCQVGQANLRFSKISCGN